MGYYTNYTLQVVPEESTREGFDKFEKALYKNTIKDTPGINDGEYVTEVIKECADRSKWYDHQDDIVLLSKVFPGCMFRLTGEGEESGDIWVKFFKDGVYLGTWTPNLSLPLTYAHFKELKENKVGSTT